MRKTSICPGASQGWASPGPPETHHAWRRPRPVAAAAHQEALAYAKERVQMRHWNPASGVKGQVAIIEHPDVRRMLMLMKSQTEAMRALAYVTAATSDRAQRRQADLRHGEQWRHRQEW